MQLVVNGLNFKTMDLHQLSYISKGSVARLTLPYLVKPSLFYDMWSPLLALLNLDTLLLSLLPNIPDIYIAPLQETYSEALSVQLRSKRNVSRSLQKEDTLF